VIRFSCRTLSRVSSSTSAALFERGWCHGHFCDLGWCGSRGDFWTEGGAEVGRLGRATAVDSGSADGAVRCGAAAPADLAFCVRGGAFPPNRNAVSLRSGSAWQVPRPVSAEASAMDASVRIEADDDAGWRVQYRTAKQPRQTLPSGLRGPVSHQKNERAAAFKIEAAGAAVASWGDRVFRVARSTVLRSKPQSQTLCGWPFQRPLSATTGS